MGITSPTPIWVADILINTGKAASDWRQKLEKKTCTFVFIANAEKGCSLAVGSTKWWEFIIEEAQTYRLILFFTSHTECLLAYKCPWIIIANKHSLHDSPFGDDINNILPFTPVLVYDVYLIHSQNDESQRRRRTQFSKQKGGCKIESSDWWRHHRWWHMSIYLLTSPRLTHSFSHEWMTVPKCNTTYSSPKGE